MLSYFKNVLKIKAIFFSQLMYSFLRDVVFKLNVLKLSLLLAFRQLLFKKLILGSSVTSFSRICLCDLLLILDL